MAYNFTDYFDEFSDRIRDIEESVYGVPNEAEDKDGLKALDSIFQNLEIALTSFIHDVRDARANVRELL